MWTRTPSGWQDLRYSVHPTRCPHIRIWKQPILFPLSPSTPTPGRGGASTVTPFPQPRSPSPQPCPPRGPGVSAGGWGCKARDLWLMTAPAVHQQASTRASWGPPAQTRSQAVKGCSGCTNPLTLCPLKAAVIPLRRDISVCHRGGGGPQFRMAQQALLQGDKPPTSPQGPAGEQEALGG